MAEGEPRQSEFEEQQPQQGLFNRIGSAIPGFGGPKEAAPPAMGSEGEGAAPPPRAPAPMGAPAPAPDSSSAPASSSGTGNGEGLLSKAKSMFGNTQAVVVIGGAIIAAIVAAIVAYFLYYLISSNITNRKSLVLNGSKVPLSGTNYTEVDATGIPASGNGKRMTMAFWIYINDINAYSGIYRHIFHRGDKGIKGASPLIFLDSSTNKIYVRFEINPKGTSQPQLSSISQPFVTYTELKPNDSTQYTLNTDSTGAVSSSIDKYNYIKFDLMNKGVVIDYVPTQRWVHIAIVVNEEVSMGTITVYVDGEMVKVVSSDRSETFSYGTYTGTTPPTISSNSINYNFQNLMLDKGGSVWVGGNQQDASIGPGFDGLVSSILFSNFDMNAKDVYDVYMRGPVDNIMAKMGLPAYGVRSPVYRLA